MSETTGTVQPDNLLDRLSIACGRLCSWLTLFMVVITFIIVVMRYAFDAGAVWLQESVTWMHAAVFMIGAAYALQQEEHVRVDIFYRGMSPARRAWVDLLGVVLFLLPVCIFLAYESWSFVEISWSLKEASREPGGLPYPWIPLLKSIVLVMPVMLALQGVSLALKSLRTLRGR